jgi:hypothetical protein
MQCACLHTCSVFGTGGDGSEVNAGFPVPVVGPVIGYRDFLRTGAGYLFRVVRRRLIDYENNPHYPSMY